MSVQPTEIKKPDLTQRKDLQTTTTPETKETSTQQANNLFDSIAKADKTNDKNGLEGNIFNKQQFNTDYYKALKSTDPNAKPAFIDELLKADRSEWKKADGKTDGLIDGASIFNIKNNEEKTNLLKLYQETASKINLGEVLGASSSRSTNSTNAAMNPFLSLALDALGLGDLKNLVATIISATPRQINNEELGDIKIKRANAAEHVTPKDNVYDVNPEALKNIKNSKTKSIQAGVYGGVKLDQGQVDNARVIAETVMQVGKEKKQDDATIRKAVVVALSTAMQESTFKVLDGGMDGDNAGVFQQRANWGSKEERLNPITASAKFANVLYKDKNLKNESVTDAAYGVQRCAAKYKNEYGKWQQMAEALTNAMLS